MQEIFLEDTKKGIPLVLVHRFLGSSNMQSLQIKFFIDNFRVIKPVLTSFEKGSANKFSWFS